MDYIRGHKIQTTLFQKKKAERQSENSPLAMGLEAYLRLTEDATREAHPFALQLYECVDTCSLQSLSGSLHQL